MKRLELDRTRELSRIENLSLKTDHVIMLGKRAVDMTVLQPHPAATRQPETVLFVPGVVAKRRLYHAAGDELSARGYRVGLMAHRAASPADVQEVAVVAREFIEGQFAATERQSKTGLVMVGHSFGGGRSILAAHQLRNAHINVDKVILEAPACYGGVSPHKAPGGLIAEVTYDLRALQGSHLGVGARAAWDAVNYLMSSKTDGVRELLTASRKMVIDTTGEMISDGMQVAGLIHRADVLIDPQISRMGMESAGITLFDTVAATEPRLHIGHNAQVYHPVHVASSVDDLIHKMRA